MSTRGWYEYYVVDEHRGESSLAFQFYKWGDATPDNAVAEVRTLTRLTHELHGEIPVHLIRAFLEDNVGAAVDSLPPSFPLGCYYFLLQRAAEEVGNPFRAFRYARLPEKKRPDFKLGLAVGKASVKKRVDLPKTDDPIIARAYFSIEVGTLVRRWQDCSSRMNFLRWLQYVTQVTGEIDMGCIAGEYTKSWDIQYVYRFFVRVPRLVRSRRNQRIARIQLELREASGRRVPGVRNLLRDSVVEECALDELVKEYPLATSAFWEGKLPRIAYLGG